MKSSKIILLAACCFLWAFFLLDAFILHFTMEVSFDVAYGKLDAPKATVSISETEVMEEELKFP